ncbi:tyrosine-type recombinase/integrase [Gemmatimonadota bacterium]
MDQNSVVETHVLPIRSQPQEVTHSSGQSSNIPLPVELLARIQFEISGQGVAYQGQMKAADPQRTRLSAFIERYIADYLQLKAKKSIRQERNRLELIKKMFDDDPFIDEITSGDVEQLLGDLLRKGRSAATYNRYRARMNSLFRKAVDWGYRSSNPVKCVERMNEIPIGDRYLLPDEFQDLLKACDDEMRPFVHIAALTGIRQSALLSILWEDIEPDLTFITVRAETTKTGESRRVPLNNEARQVLRELGHHAIGRVFTFEVFPRTRWNQIRTKLGWDTTKVRRIHNWRFHDLRHCCATWLVMADVPLFKVGRILGHKQLTTTQRYAHLTESSLADAMERINSTSPSEN